VSIITFIHTLIAIVAINKLETHQIDVKIYFFKTVTLMKMFTWNKMRGLLSNGKKKYIYKLVKSLYGLEQVPKYCDSQSAIERTQSSMYNGMSRHIHHRYNIAKHLLLNEINFIDYVK
jgi:hypothetical protein